jgi:hypothetical protein
MMVEPQEVEGKDEILVNIAGNGNLNFPKKFLIPIDDVSDMMIKKYSQSIKKDEVKNIFDYGIYLSTLINKTLTDDKMVYVYMTLLNPSPNEVFRNIVEGRISDIKVSYVVFGVNEELQSTKINAIFKKVGTVVTQDTVDDVLWGEIGFLKETIPFYKTLSEITQNHNKVMEDKKSMIEKIDFDLDGDKDFVSLKSEKRKVETKLQVLNEEIDNLYRAEELFKSIQKIKKLVDFDSKHTEEISNFDFNGGISHPVKLKYNFSALNAKLPMNYTIKSVNSPDVKTLLSKIKSSKVNDNSILSFIEYEESEEDELPQNLPRNNKNLNKYILAEILSKDEKEIISILSHAGLIYKKGYDYSSYADKIIKSYYELDEITSRVFDGHPATKKKAKIIEPPEMQGYYREHNPIRWIMVPPTPKIELSDSIYVGNTNSYDGIGTPDPANESGAGLDYIF